MLLDFIKLVAKLRQQYRNMSDDELDEFSKEMLLHFIENTAAAAAARQDSAVPTPQAGGLAVRGACARAARRLRAARAGSRGAPRP